MTYPARPPVLYDAVKWGTEMCHAPRCLMTAEALMDGTPLCFDCIELIVERAQAVEILPELRELLPPLWGR